MSYNSTPQLFLKEIKPDTPPFNIYILMGEEEYFTDKIEKKLHQTYIPEEVEDFNLSLFYGSESSMSDVIASCRRVPMGATYTMTIVREAQHFLRGNGDQSIDLVLSLVENPVPHNILVLSFKGKAPTKTSKLIKGVERKNIVIESPAVKEWQIMDYIPALAQEAGLTLESDALKMMAEHLGTDIGRISSELEKLSLALNPVDRKRVSAEMLLTFTGFNKEYTPFDLRKALVTRDAKQVIKVVSALAKDEKNTPVQVIIPVLFNFYAQLLIAIYAPDKNSLKSIAQYMGFTKEFQARDYMTALRYYKPHKVISILSYLRKLDARSKGMYSEENSSEEILMDLALMILN